MRDILLLCCALLMTTLNLQAQKKSPATYPALNAPKTETARTFASIFDENNVGNLHVFPTNDEEAEYDYYFRGRPLPDNLYGLFPEKWEKLIAEQQAEVFTTYVIRGENDAYFIVRLQSPEMGQRLELFDLKDGSLRHLHTLAFADCNRGRCIQQDAWILDLDGNTRLDIIKKVRITDRYTGQAIDEYANVYTQTNDGIYYKTDDLTPELDTYLMQELEETEK